MLTRPETNPVPWPEERIGYTHESKVAYAPSDTQKLRLRNYNGLRLEKRIGGALLAAGAVWAGYEAVHNSNLMAFVRDMTPLEVSAAGLLLRLHVMWKRSTHLI